MATMTTPAQSFLPFGRELTHADLQTVPDDGHRYELIDGVLIVTPAPRTQHQRAVRELVILLSKACPEEYEVLFAPLDVALSDDTVIQPDVLVATRDAFTATGLDGAPLLAIEVLSPSTRSIDMLLKKDRLQRAGCPHYWVIDPDEPSIIAWTLIDGTYREAARVSDNQTFEATLPFSVQFSPSTLVLQ